MGENQIVEQTGLGVLCDKVIEASWLVLVVVAPLFFNVYSHRSFEPDKTALIRPLALVMGLAWVIRELEARSWKLKVNAQYPIPNIQYLARTPLTLPTLLLAIVCILATITSIAPRLSLWGSYHRMQGAYTTLSFVVIFFVILHTLRDGKQLHRLIAVVLITSLPVSLYGIMQHYGLDPIVWTTISDPVTVRAISTMGNPIFLAAYLVMIIPLTVGRLMQILTIIGRGKRAASLYFLGGCYAVLLIVQLLCFLFTQSRGPLFGLVGGVFFFILILAAARGDKGLAWGILGIAVIFGLFLMALNLSDSPLEFIREMPYLGRLSGALDLQSRTARQRMLIWEGATNLIAADPKRIFVGYGPETLAVALNPYVPIDLVSLKPNETFDRAHNETLDALATTGFVGLVIYVVLFSSLFYHGLKYLGLIESSRHRRLFTFLLVVGGVVGGLLPWFLEGKWRFVGVGIPAGMLLVLAIYLMTTFKAQSSKLKAQTQTSNLQLLLIALLSAVIAHFIEIQLGIAIVATRTYFWIYAVLIIVIGLYLKGGVSSSSQPAGRQAGRAEGASLVSFSLLVGLVLATMGLDLISGHVNSPGQLLSLLGFFVMVWLICNTVAIVEAEGGIAALATISDSTPFLVSLGWFVMFLVVHFIMRENGTALFISYYIYLLLTVVVISIALLKARPASPHFGPKAQWWPYPFLILGAGVLIIRTNLNPIAADIYYNQGLAYADSGRWDESIALLQKALHLAPGQDFYYLFLAGANVEKARATSDTAQRTAWLEEAQRALERGREINPLNPDHVSKLGLLYRVWGEMLTDQQEKTDKFNQALDYYRQAQALRPHDPNTFNQWGLVHSAKGEYEQAVDKYQRSLNLNRGSVQTYLLLGDAYQEMEELTRAAEAYGGAVWLAPDDFVAHRSLALLYDNMGRIEEAIAEAEMAYSLAPGNEAAALESLIIYLRSRR